MLRLGSLGDGDYLIFNDYIGDFKSSIALIVVLILYGIATANPFINNPQAFSGAIAALIIALALYFFIATIQGFEFVRFLALPFFVYALASTGIAMVENVSASLGLLMLVVVPFSMLLGGIGIYALMFGIDGAVFPGFITFGFLTYMSFAGGGRSLFYFMRVTDIVALISAIAVLYHNFKNRKGFNFIATKINCLLILVGVLIVPILLFARRIISNHLIYFIFINLIFIALTIVIDKKIKSLNLNLSGGYEGMLFGVFILAIFILLSNFQLNIFDELVAPSLSMLSSIPNLTRIAYVTADIYRAFASFYSMILEFAINLILMIFDTSIPNITLAYQLGFILMIFNLFLDINLTVKILNRKK